MTIARTVRPRFNWFMALMWHKLALPKNQAKEDWRQESRDYLLGRLLREVAELVEADPADSKAVALEAADVANIALMIADHARGSAEAPRAHESMCGCAACSTGRQGKTS